MDDEFGVTRGSTNFENTNGTSQSFAAGFRNRGAAMTTDDLRRQRESRAADALRMKDDQLNMLSEQNRNLLTSLDKVSFQRSVYIRCIDFILMCILVALLA